MKTIRRENEPALPLDQLIAGGDDAPSVEEKLDLIRFWRTQGPQAVERLDRFLVEESTRLRQGLDEARESQRKLKTVVERLTQPPWHGAILLAMDTRPPAPKALVLHGNAKLAVGIAEDVDPGSLSVGQEVLLGPELNVVVAVSPYVCRTGETASFDRYTDDRRLVLRARDAEVVVDASEALRREALESGDEVRWDPRALMAFERIERTDGRDLFLEETPAETFAQIGGLGRQIEELQRAIGLHLRHADLARKYQLRRKGSVLLVGPPGTGKTMIARALANWIGQISCGRRARFMNIKPAGLHSMWYSQSEANYREAFRVAREAGAADPDVPVVMFFDEVDSIGSPRGEALMRVDDRVLTAFMTELDGLESRGNILVVAATNRRDALDPALLRPGRLGDLELIVPRPNMAAARDIFGKHLPADLPFAAAGRSNEEARLELIESVVSRIYAPNAGSEVATITFRDGKERQIRGPDLMTGASIAKIAQGGRERAYLREAETGESGLRIDDLLPVVVEELDRAARMLTPANCRRHLSDLPHDVDVVRIEPARRATRRLHRYVSVA